MSSSCIINAICNTILLLIYTFETTLETFKQDLSFKITSLWAIHLCGDLCLLCSGSESWLPHDNHDFTHTLVNKKEFKAQSWLFITWNDLKIFKDDDEDLHTTIFRKTADFNIILRAGGFHPPRIIKNISLGEFQRIERICDSERDFERNERKD